MNAKTKPHPYRFRAANVRRRWNYVNITFFSNSARTPSHRHFMYVNLSAMLTIFHLELEKEKKRMTSFSVK